MKKVLEIGAGRFRNLSVDVHCNINKNTKKTFWDVDRLPKFN